MKLTIDFDNLHIEEAKKNNQLILYTILAFSIPLLLNHPQILLGSIINTLLFLTAFLNPGKKGLIVVTMPVLSVLLSNTLLGPLTKFILYFLPFIWIGNTVLVYGFRFFINRGMSLASFPLAIMGKVLIISLASIFLIKMNIVSDLFLIPMGVMQLVTASIGAIAASVISSKLLK